MQKKRNNLSIGLFLIGFILLLGSGAAATEIYWTDANGKIIQELNPVLVNWIIYDPSIQGVDVIPYPLPGSQTNHIIKLGYNNWDANETKLQVQGVSGAGLEIPAYNLRNAYNNLGARNIKVDFDYRLNTWDSYNLNVGPGDGYWDVIGININQTGYYWDLASIHPPNLNWDSIISPDPNGVPKNSNHSVVTSHIQGETWAFGGKLFGTGKLETVGWAHDQLEFSFCANKPLYISVFLDTDSQPDFNVNFPSWGQFNTDKIKADMTVRKYKAIPRKVPINEKFRYTVTVKNIGSETAENVRLAVTLPPNYQDLEFRTLDCVHVGDAIICELYNMEKGRAKTREIRLSVGQPGVFVTKATVTANNDINLSNNSKTTMVNVKP